jgi:beta-phosphoglucomutase
MTMPAFIFDMDGTIVDNMAFHTKSWLEFFARRGKEYEAEAFFRETAGAQGREILRERLGADVTDEEIAELAAEKDALYREMYGPHRRAIQGFDDFVTQADARGVALAVATSAPPKNIVFTLDELDLRRHFAAVVGAADVKQGKPHPDVFLKAAERLGADPADCIVFEDAPLGVEAARRAGMRAVVITSTLPADAFAEFDNVVRIVGDYDELDLRRRFDAVVGAADVARGKPHPDVFLKAAEKLGADPADCIVFEDAPLGVEAARRAGMRAVVITTTLPAEAFAEFDNVIRIVEHYEDLNVVDVRVGDLLGPP